MRRMKYKREKKFGGPKIDVVNTLKLLNFVTSLVTKQLAQAQILWSPSPHTALTKSKANTENRIDTHFAHVFI